jgi:hypothetical protein
MLRTYGRAVDLNTGKLTWREVTTDANGNDDLVWITTLAQTLKLNLGESPFFGNYGIPAHQSVVQQIYPDYYVAITQQQFSARFASLIITRVPGEQPVDGFHAPPPTYRVAIVTHFGSILPPFEIPTQVPT